VGHSDVQPSTRDLTPADEGVLERWLRGTASAADTSRAQALTHERPELAAFLRQLRAPQEEWARPSVEFAYSEFLAQRHVAERKSDGVTRLGILKYTPTRTLRWVRQNVAAAVAAAAVIASVIGVVQLASRPGNLSVASPRVYRTAAGERATVSLADGNHVVLAPNTTLTVRSQEVSLDGRAYFTVVPRSERAFMVRTGTVTTRVLGTAFDVDYDARTGITQVVVVDGRIRTGAQRQQRTLTAYMLARMTDSTTTVTKIPDPAPFVEWQTGRLHFRDTPVSEVLAAVERWYGITVRLTDSVVMRDHLTATIDVRHSRNGTLTTLASSLGVRLRMVADTAILGPRIPAAPTSGMPRRSIPQLDSPKEVGR
jgi:transmembrane sensor